MNKTFKQGVGLLELMLAIAIISLLMISAIRYFSIVNRSNRVNQALTEVNAIRAAGERWKATHDDNYKTLTAGTELKDLVNRGLLPDIYGLDSVKNPWGGTITATMNPADNSQLNIKFSNVTNPDCTNFVKIIKKNGCTPTPADTCNSSSTSIDVTASC